MARENKRNESERRGTEKAREAVVDVLGVVDENKWEGGREREWERKREKRTLSRSTRHTLQNLRRICSYLSAESNGDADAFIPFKEDARSRAGSSALMKSSPGS